MQPDNSDQNLTIGKNAGESTEKSKDAIQLVLMGVSGSGKSTIGRLVEREIGWPFFDADDFHSTANVEKMAAGYALTDVDRKPWLSALRRHLDQHQKAGLSTVLACSALKFKYREALRLPGVRFVFLHGSMELIAARLAERKGHYMPSSLLESQFDALEGPLGSENILQIDIAQSPEHIRDEIISKIEHL